MVMSSMDKLLSYVKLTRIFERFCHVLTFATLREGGLQQFNFSDRQNFEGIKFCRSKVL